MSLKLKLHDNGIWYVSGTVTVWKNGRNLSIEVRRSTKAREYVQADAIRRQIENEVAERNISGREPAITFAEAAARYVKHGGEARYLALPLSRLGGDRIDAIDQTVIDDAAADTFENPATRRRQFYTPVIAVLKFNGIATTFRRPPEGKKRTFWHTPDQAVALIDRIAANAAGYQGRWAPALATFLFAQGPRIGETMAIDAKRDVSLKHRYVIMRETKNGEERMLRLCPRTVAALSPLPNIGETGPLFRRFDGTAYARAGSYQFSWWERAVTELGLDEHSTIHTARHSWATWFYSQTLDVLRLKVEGGWASGEWERYVKLANRSVGIRAAELGFDFGTEHEPGTDFAGFLRKVP